jgi:hypothetical protein
MGSRTRCHFAAITGVSSGGTGERSDHRYIRTVSRQALLGQVKDAGLEGFERALKAVKALNVCRSSEIMLAIENWVADNMMTDREAGALYAYYGWERGQ